jgi:hypothetical protein
MAATGGALSAEQVREHLRALQAQDLPSHGGRTLAYVYDSGLAEADAIGLEALAMFAGSNGLDPTAFPSLLAMENDLLGLAVGLLDAPDTVVGSVTSGGTESVLLAVLAARDGAGAGPGRASMVLPSTAHAAFHKAAHYFGVEPIVVDVDPATFRADPSAMAAAIRDDTVLVVASAPSYAHGVIDPVPEIAAAAAARGVRCHVDACIGGWVLSFPSPAPRFVVAQGSLLRVGGLARLHDAQRDPPVDQVGWPAGCRVGRHAFHRRRGVCRVVPDRTAGDPCDREGSGRHTGTAGRRPAGLDLARRGDRWLVRRLHDRRRDAVARVVRPAADGLPRNAGDPPPHAVGSDRALGPETARQAGPIAVDPGLAEAATALDPDALSDSDFDGLLALAGLAGGDGSLALPERMAPVNALLDVAPPALREALLLAFLDRLSRPTRD